MTLTLILVVAVVVIWFAERSVEHLKLAIAVLCFSAAVLLFVVADFGRAILLSCILAAAISGASRVKYNHSGRKLIVTDLPLAFAGTIPFFLVQYPLAAIAVLVGSIGLILAAVAALYVRGPPVSLELQILLFSIALFSLVAAYRTSGGAVPYQRIAAQRRCFFSTFMASLLDRLSWRQFGGLALSDIANDPLPLMPAVPARSPSTIQTLSSSSTNQFSIRVLMDSPLSQLSKHFCLRKMVCMEVLTSIFLEEDRGSRNLAY
jgi:hypothetical protein